MNHSEAALLLAQVQAFDRRTVGDADVLAWQAALYDVNLPNARAAVIHHVRTKPGVWIEPGHIRALVKLVRDEAVKRAGIPVPQADPDDVAAYRAELIESVKRIADSAGSEMVGDLPQLASAASPRSRDIREEDIPARDRARAEAMEKAKAALAALSGQEAR